MAQEIADSKLLDTWGSSGTKIEPDISKIIEGWQLGEQPPHEYMNWLQNIFGSKLNHILKNGIAKWNKETEYLAGSSVQHNGNVWLCKVDNTNSEPTDSSNNWSKMPSLENLALTVDTINDFPSGATTRDVIIVKDLDRGGIFIYDSTKVDDDNQGTNFNGWIRQYSGAVNVKWFGAKGDGITDDRQAFNKALLASDEIEAPEGNIFLFDVTGGRSSAVDVVSNKTIIINGTIKSNYGQLQDNAPTLFRVTGDNVLFYGGGSLIGDGTINALNTGTVEQSPSLLWVEGDNFKIKDVIIDTPPKSGIILYGCMNANISTTFKGGYTADISGESGYFGVNSLYGGGHKIYDCVFGLNVDGGKFVNSIFLVSSNCSITNNVAYHALEKLVYCTGNDNLIEGNSFFGIPAGSFTDAYRLTGNRNTLIANYAINTSGGCQILNGGQNRVINNMFINCKQVGVNIEDNSSIGANNLSDNEVIGNYIEGIENTAVAGIQFVSSYNNVDNVKIEGNTINGFNIVNGNGILISNPNAFLMTNTIIANNKINNCYYGISTSKAKYTNINNNNIKNLALYAINENAAEYSSICNNNIRGAGYNAFVGITSTSNFRGNTFNNIPNSGQAMLSTTVTTTVVHGGLAPHALITITNGNAKAGVLQAITGLFTTNNGDGTFSITTGNYGNPVGTEILIYDIIQ